MDSCEGKKIIVSGRIQTQTDDDDNNNNNNNTLYIIYYNIL
jgi:hypothetical protein